MVEQALSTRVSLHKNKSESIDIRRISLPMFSTDSGKDIPNYLRSSLGSCHDYCKYGKETISIRQNRHSIEKPAAQSQVIFPTVKSSKISMKNASSKQPLEKGKSAEFPTSSESKLLKEKSLVKKTGATSGIKKFNRSSTVKEINTVTKSLIHLPKKMNGIKRPPPPLSPSPSKLATKGKTLSSSRPPPVKPIAKLRPLSLPNQLKTKSVAARSLSSSATTKKNKAAALKAVPPIPLIPRNASVKKNLNFKDQNGIKGDASKVMVSKAVAPRHGSITHTSKTARKLKGKVLEPARTVDIKIAEANKVHEIKEEEPSHATESRTQEGMESYDEVPEKTLYVIEMEPGNITKPPQFSEIEVEYVDLEDDHLVNGENLKDTENAELKKSDVIPFKDCNKDPVKLMFRRGRVIDVTQESNAPRRLKFRKEHVSDEVLKSNLNMTETTQENVINEKNSGTVILRHQDLQDKKHTQGLFNNVIEETACKLAETRKSKVKALVGAFESLISFQDGKTFSTR